MIIKTKLKMAATAAALLAVMAAIAPVSAAPPHGDGQRNYSNNGMRHFDGKRHRRYGNRSHNNRGFSLRLPGVRIYSGESNRCGYSYRKWQMTGSRYWRSRYYDCRHG